MNATRTTRAPHRALAALAALLLVAGCGGDATDPCDGSPDCASRKAVLAGTIELPDTLREGIPVTARLRLENRSRYAALPDTQLVLCINDNDVLGCDAHRVHAILLRTPVAAIPPGGTRQLDVHVTVGREFWGSGSVELPFTDMVLYAQVDWDLSGWARSGALQLLPNLPYHCGARTAAPGTVVEGSTVVLPTCRVRAVGTDDVDILTLQQPAGTTLRLELLAAERSETARVALVSHDGQWLVEATSAPFQFTFPDDRPVHAVVASAGAYRLDVRTAPVP